MSSEDLQISCEGFGEDPHPTDELTCAICLSATAPTELALIKGCEHLYCVCCILKWAALPRHDSETPKCPQCKLPFEYLFVHRMLDGELSDFPVEESVCLLKRASWFTEHVREMSNGKLLSGTDAANADDHDPYYDEYDEDEEIESFFFSRASGRARVVLGNRRLGENGFMRSGRMFARPTGQTTRNKNSKSSKKAGPSAAAACGGEPGSSSSCRPDESYVLEPRAGVGRSTEEPDGFCVQASNASAPKQRQIAADAVLGAQDVSSKKGRRAKRSARRVANDLRDEEDEW